MSFTKQSILNPPRNPSAQWPAKPANTDHAYANRSGKSLPLDFGFGMSKHPTQYPSMGPPPPNTHIVSQRFTSISGKVLYPQTPRQGQGWNPALHLMNAHMTMRMPDLLLTGRRFSNTPPALARRPRGKSFTFFTQGHEKMSSRCPLKGR